MQTPGGTTSSGASSSAAPPPSPSGGSSSSAAAGPAVWPGPLPHPILIADRGNSRILEVTPAQQVVWQFPAPAGLPAGQSFVGGDDAFFTPGGGAVISNEEHNATIAVIDYATRRIVWQYGHAGVEDSPPGFLDYPDDAYQLPSGDVVVADIRNCRVLFIDPQMQIQQSWGQAGHCVDQPPQYLDYPNGDAPQPNGDILVIEINGGSGDSRAVLLTAGGGVVWNVQIPDVLYGSDAQLLPDGDVLCADYSRPGRVVVFNPLTGAVDWTYDVQSGAGMLDHPSIAEALSNGDYLVSDDYRDRVVVIDPETGQIVWQYGHTDVAGTGSGDLNTPDGMDSDIYHELGA